MKHQVSKKVIVQHADSWRSPIYLLNDAGNLERTKSFANNASADVELGACTHLRWKGFTGREVIVSDIVEDVFGDANR